MGYPDFSRLSQHGTDPLTSFNWPGGTQTVSEVLDVSAYENLLVVPKALTGFSACEVGWLVTSTPPDAISVEWFAVAGAANCATPLVFPCVSSYAVVAANLTTGTGTGNMWVYGDVRTKPVRSLPRRYAVQAFVGDIPAGGSTDVIPEDYLSGPVQLSLFTADAAHSGIALFTYDENLASQEIWFTALSSSESVFTVNFPLGYSVITLSNSATTPVQMTLTYIMSPTGA